MHVITNCVTCLSIYVVYGLRVWNKDLLLLLLLLYDAHIYTVWNCLFLAQLVDLEAMLSGAPDAFILVVKQWMNVKKYVFLYR